MEDGRNKKKIVKTADCYFYRTYSQESPQTEVRKHVDIEEHFHFIANQGKICNDFPESYYFSDELSRETKSGCGFFACIPVHLGGKCFVLSCAHLFISINKCLCKIEYPESASFSFRPIAKEKMEVDKIEAKHIICDIFYHPSYFKESFEMDFYNGLVLAVCENSLSSEYWSPKNVALANVSVAKKGDEICVFGAEREGKLFSCSVGNIANVVYKSEEEALIVYENINTSREMSGSPVYIKQGDSWAIIGVHVAYDEMQNCNVAIGLTRSKLHWILETAQRYVSSKRQINSHSGYERVRDET